jgi:hypothetical protein
MGSASHIRKGFGRSPLPAMILMLITMVSCDESLPPREQPATVLVPSIEILNPPIIAIRDSLPTGTTGAFLVKVLNVYDEVLQDTARVRLDLEIWLKDHPEHRAVVAATEEDLVNSRILSGRILTLGVDTAAIIQRQWDHRASDGVPFWRYVSTYPASTPSGVPFCESDTVTFRVKATVQLFNIVQPQILPEWEFRIVYRVFGVTCQVVSDELPRHQ